MERVTEPTELKHWEGRIEAYWIYTSGKAGDHFFKKLKEEGKFTASKCKKCGKVYFPPRIYCERDLEETEFIEVSGEGEVESFTIAKLDPYERELPKPQIYALIRIYGTDGRLIHLLGGVEPENVKIGMRVRPVLKPKEEREGRITDLLYFKPI